LIQSNIDSSVCACDICPTLIDLDLNRRKLSNLYSKYNNYNNNYNNNTNNNRKLHGPSDDFDHFGVIFRGPEFPRGQQYSVNMCRN
jgi:hypothetical protein